MPVQSLYVTCMANTDKGANKVWGAMVLTDGQNYQYVAFWGKRNSHMADERLPFESRVQAFGRFSKVIQQKVSDGYKNVDPSYSKGMSEKMVELRKGPLIDPAQPGYSYLDAVSVPVTADIGAAISTLHSTISTASISGYYDGPGGLIPVAYCILCAHFVADKLDPYLLEQVCGVCTAPIAAHTKSHPHVYPTAHCAGAVVKNDLLLPPKASPAPDAIPHLECRCGHCMNSHGAVDGAIPCLVSTCKCEAYRYRCPECDSLSVDGGWRHSASCVTGYRLKPSQEVERGKRLPRRTSDLVDDV